MHRMAPTSTAVNRVIAAGWEPRAAAPQQLTGEPSLPRRCMHCQRPYQPGKGSAQGRCAACYQYRRRHACERPLGPRGPRPCSTCGRHTPRPTRARCRVCDAYWRRHGVERRPDEGPQPTGSRECQICGRVPRTRGLVHGRCGACRAYWRRRGAERPAAGVIAAPAVGTACVNCGEPAARPRRGRCGACDTYWRRHRAERLRRLRGGS